VITLWLACSWADPGPLQPVVSGLPNITDIQPIPGHDEVVVLTKGGGVHRVTLGSDGAEASASTWFEVPVRTASEQGVLGIAFASDFATSGHFFLHISPEGGERRGQVSRWSTDPAQLTTPQRLGTVLEVQQPWPNHNGGQLQVGPDGMLYVALGDGGSADDPKGAGQDRSTWLGSILRLDVSDPAVPYAVPPSNPFVGQEGVKPEIWAYGLRNPWRFVILPDGRAVIGDVGQNEVEEVTIGAAGANHGWKTFEGDRCFDPPCARAGLTMPVHTYTHDVGQSITGGVVPTSGPHEGRYLFADFVSGRLWSMDLSTFAVELLADTGEMVSTFGLDPQGAPLVGGYRSGTLYRLP